MPEFLTTKEVAALLRIKERKVYELVATQAIPVSRVTGKLLFPRAMVEAWVWQQADYAGGIEALHGRPPVIAGSHDPLLEWALRESGSELAAFLDGSLDGLARLAAGKAIAAGMHVYEPEAEDWNRGHLERAMAGMPVVLVEWAWRVQGLVVPAGNPKGIAGLGDLVGLTLMPRQELSGSHILLDYLMQQAGLEPAGSGWWHRRRAARPTSRSRSPRARPMPALRSRRWRASSASASCRCSASATTSPCGGATTSSRRSRGCSRSAADAAFRTRAEELGGYDVSGLGQVHYNGP